jgi:hypothetical protein
LKICSKEFEFDDALRLTTVVRCQNSIWWSIGLCLSDILLNTVVNTAHVSFWEALFEAEKPNCNLHRNIFDLSWENNWPFANVNLISAALHRLRWCWTKRLVWHPLVWQLCWWILATFMIFQSVVPTFLLTTTQKTAFKFASPLATGWQRNHAALVFACQL